MKVLILSGSPRPEGNTPIAPREMGQVFQAENVETELVPVGKLGGRSCTACSGYAKPGEQVGSAFQDGLKLK